MEICEDVWTPIPPSTYAALAGATILTNLSASNITIGKADYRRDLCAGQSGKCIAAYLYSAAGPGESTTDLAWDGHALIYENNERLAESERFADREQMITGDIGSGTFAQDRMRSTSFNDSISECRDKLQSIRRVAFEFKVSEATFPFSATCSVSLTCQAMPRPATTLLRSLQHPGPRPHETLFTAAA